MRLRSRDWFGYVNEGDGGGGGGGIGDRRKLVTPEIFVFGSRPHGYCVTAWWRALYVAALTLALALALTLTLALP